MRLKVLEAMARRKAVVTTSIGAEGFSHFGEELPFVVADDTRAFAAAVAELLASARRRRALAERAREFARRHHSPAAWARRLEAVYEEASAAPGRGARGPGSPATRR